MKSAIYIYISLIFFVYIIVCSMVYMMLRSYKEKLFNKRIERLKKTFGIEVLDELNRLKKHGDLDYSKISYFESKIKRKIYEEVFNRIIIEFNEKEQNPLIIKDFIKNFERYIKNLIKRYNRSNSNMKKIYIVYILSQYKLDRKYIGEFLIKALDTNDLYLRAMIYKSLSNIGNINNFIEALNYMSINNQYLNEKIFTDNIDNFNGDKEKLNKSLINNINSFNYKIQIVIITHFRNVCENSVKEELFEILWKNKCNKEVKASIIKYFGKVKYDLAKDKLMEFLKNDEWEIKALSAKALGIYESEDVLEALMESIEDSNWYIRLNSAMSIINFSENQDTIKNVLNGKDRYARDIMIYSLFNRNIISYEQYEGEKIGEKSIEELEEVLC